MKNVYLLAILVLCFGFEQPETVLDELSSQASKQEEVKTRSNSLSASMSGGDLSVARSNSTAPRSTGITISGEGVSRSVSIIQLGEKVSLIGSSGQLEGFDPTMPAYTSGPFEPTVSGVGVEIKTKNNSSISTNCLPLNLSIRAGDWVRGELTVTIGKVINARVSPTPFIGTGAPNGVYVSMTGPNDVIVNYSGTVGPNADAFTRFWWIPVTADGQQGFILDVL